MKSISERDAFSQRLAKALKEAKIEVGSPTVFAREFNRRYTGKPVSTHAARKWLMGESIPTQDKLRLLAAWLGVSAEWLRFGEGGSADKQIAQSDRAHYNSPDIELIGNINLLTTEHKQVVREVVLTLLRLEKKR
jgi:transcriptional regulator with XRE-family HTH domain